MLPKSTEKKYHKQQPYRNAPQKLSVELATSKKCRENIRTKMLSRKLPLETFVKTICNRKLQKRTEKKCH